MKVCGCVLRKEIWIMDPAADQYYRWLTVIAIPVFYNLMMIVTRYGPLQVLLTSIRNYVNAENKLTLSTRACFNELQDTYTKCWIVLDYTSDLIYLADTFVRSRTGQNPAECILSPAVITKSPNVAFALQVTWSKACWSKMPRNCEINIEQHPSSNMT